MIFFEKLPAILLSGDPDKAQESAWKKLAETLDTSMLKTQDAAEEITDVTLYAPDVELPKAQIPSAGAEDAGTNSPEGFE